MYEGRTKAESGIVFGHENMCVHHVFSFTKLPQKYSLVSRGIVEDVGSGVAFLKPGDRVVMPFNVACGRCRNCEGKKTA